MNFDVLLLVLPELFQLLLTLFLFAAALFFPGEKVSLKWLRLGAFLNILISFYALNLNGLIFAGVYQVDQLSQFFKLAIAIGFWFILFTNKFQPTLDDQKNTDYFFLLSMSVWGLMLLASTVELITIYVALEVSSYSLYTLVALRKKSRKAAEAGIKYILFGAAATAISLYGFSYIIGTFHTSYLNELTVQDWSFSSSPAAVIGLCMFLFGFFFKLALFPFHFWAPDIYEGASNETAAYIASIPKLGAAVIFIRLCAFFVPGEMSLILAVCGAISMTYGNLSALAQTDLKRLIGYSSMAHAGYLTLGLIAGTADGFAAVSFYIFIYILMNLAIFTVITHLAKDGKNVSLSDLDGLHARNPLLAMILLVSAFSLVGLPPTAGFMGKLFLLTSAWDQGYNWLVIVAAVNTAISIYYYLNLVRHAYTKDPNTISRPMKEGHLWWGALLAGIVLILGIMPYTVFKYAIKAGQIFIL